MNKGWFPKRDRRGECYQNTERVALKLTKTTIKFFIKSMFMKIRYCFHKSGLGAATSEASVSKLNLSRFIKKKKGYQIYCRLQGVGAKS